MAKRLKVTKYRFYERYGRIYADYQTNKGRYRIDLKLEYNEDNLKIVNETPLKYIYAHLNLPMPNTRIKKPFYLATDKFLAENYHLKPQTMISYKNMIKMLNGFFKGREIESLTSDDSRELYNHLLQCDSAEYKANLFNRIVPFANEMGANLKTIKVKNLKKVSSEEVVLPFTLEEVRILLENAEGDLRAFICLMAFSGMRTGEVLALNWTDIDFQLNKIRVCKSMQQNGIIGTTKTNQIRNIDLLRNAREGLESLSETRIGRIFKYYRSAHLYKEWDALLQKCEIQHRRIYNLRHTFATLMLTNNQEHLWIS
ncbi:MAG: site-specific integrase [Helicobacteraceae bacterium]|nr:site-specific integrase [Helicobacteraceae bacterium]